MTAAGRYAELAAAVRSFKAELIQPSQLERFLESGSLAEIVSTITGGRITSVDASDLSPVESLLVQRSMELAKRLASYAPQDSRPLVNHFSRGFEYACVKEILKASSDQVDPEEALRHIVPAGKFTADRCKDLIESHNPNRVIESIDDEALRRFVAPKLTGERASFQTVAAIDQYYFMKMSAASNLPDPLDTQSGEGLDWGSDRPPKHTVGPASATNGVRRQNRFGNDDSYQLQPRPSIQRTTRSKQRSEP